MTKGYDALERLTNVVNKNSGGTDLSSYSYDYDEDSDRTSVSELDGSEVTYGYDDLHRLTSEVRTGTDPYNYSNTLDPSGNRTVWTDNTNSTEVDYTYDSANRLTAAGNYSYGYDNDGNRTSVTVGGNTTNYYFDYEDRLDAIGTSVSYSYIGAGTDRFSKTVSGTTTDFLYDNGSVDEEMQGSTVTADYGANAEKLSGTVSWMLQDGQGSTRQLLNSSQTVVATYISDAFGNSLGGSGTSANPFRWNGGSGYYSDAESGLQKVGARFYDPAVGRWISQDTLLVAGSASDSQSINRYCYCESGPIGQNDPSGHFIIALLIVIDFALVLYDSWAYDKAFGGGVPNGAVNMGSFVGGYAAPSGGSELAGACNTAIYGGIAIVYYYTAQVKEELKAQADVAAEKNDQQNIANYYKYTQPGAPNF